MVDGCKDGCVTVLEDILGLVLRMFFGWFLSFKLLWQEFCY